MRLPATSDATLVSDNGIGYNVRTLDDIDHHITDLTRRIKAASPQLPRLRAMIERDRDQLLELRAARQEATT
jgi:hypothetical protein